jgi:hypothetical protein
LAKLEEIIILLTDEVTKKYNIADQDELKKIITTNLSELKNQIFDQILQKETKGTKGPHTLSNEEASQLLNDISALKEWNHKLTNDYTKLSEQFDKIASQAIPNFEDIKQKIIQETVSQEKAKHEQQIAMILRDLQNRVDKVISNFPYG